MYNIKFEENKTYNFDFNRKVIDKNGYTYFYLTYEGTNTMPGYENNVLEYRVKALDFQKEWTEMEIREKMPHVPCKVSGFYTDHNDGQLTLFPYLVIDRCAFLKSQFQEGKTYFFIVEGRERDEENNREFFYLRDEKVQMQHRFYIKKNILWNVGDRVEFEVQNITKRGLLKLFSLPSAFLKAEIAALKPTDNLYGQRENESLEFKSSFIYTAEGEENIDEQLGHEIVAQLAGFMNAGGGTVYLGYRDDGSLQHHRQCAVYPLYLSSGADLLRGFLDDGLCPDGHRVAGHCLLHPYAGDYHPGPGI